MRGSRLPDPQPGRTCRPRPLEALVFVLRRPGGAPAEMVLDALAAGVRTLQDGGEVLRALPQRSSEARRVEPVSISRQALVRVEGAQYSPAPPDRRTARSAQALVRVEGAQYSGPSHWSGSQGTAHMGGGGRHRAGVA